jgi:DNA-binding CsgD family transcriptional regulator
MRSDLQVGFMNCAASSALATDGITISSQGTLRLSQASASERLSKTMKALTSEVSLHVFAFELPDGTARVLKIETLDISPFACLEEGFGGVWFEVSVRASLRCLKVPADRVAPALQLTSAEANLASALAEGLTLHDYAERENLKITTVRWHLQNVFNRTGMRSQSELVGMMVSLFG